MSMRQRRFVSDEMSALRSILAKNGFGAAANNLRIGDLRNVEDTMRLWEGYPRTMEQYPVRLSKRSERGFAERASGYR